MMAMEWDRMSNREVKRINRIRTIRSILACDHISQPELAAKLNHSWPTVLQNVKELMEMGLVEEAGSFESTGGRKARAFAPVRDAKLAVGLDITQNHLSAVLVDLSGDLLLYHRQKSMFAMTDAYFKELGAMVQKLIAKRGCPAEKILGVGISLPGIVDQGGQMLTYSHALGLRNVALETFSRHIPYPCLFINDANAAGFAEVRDREVRGNLVYLSLSNSVGGAILTGGALYTGDHLRAGEFGHNTLVPDGKPCYCGKQGCLDAYCSAKVLSSLTEDNLPLFFDGLRVGNARLQAAWDEYLGFLAVAVNNLRMTFDCDVMVGGYVGGFMETFGGHFRKLLMERNTFEPNASYFRLCRYKLEASAVGAALLHVEAFLERL